MQERNLGVSIECCAAVMTVKTLKKFIALIAKAGYDFVELCTNETYKIDGEPYFGYLQGGYTKGEIREVDAYAKTIGIELVPSIQTLAHLKNLAKLPAYDQMFDVNDILMIDEPRTYELIDKMFKTISEAYSSRKVNIGYDEAHLIGLGRYLDKHGYHNRFELLLKHLNKVVEIAAKYGFKIHMWSDMFFRLANGGKYFGKDVHIPEEVRKAIPENVELCFWDYYDSDEELYDKMLSSHEEFNRELWFAGGAWVWNGFAPLNHLSFKTMQPAMRQVISHNVKNVLVTLWGDDGHDCSFFAALPAIFAIARYARGEFNHDAIAKEFEETYGVAFEDMLLLDIPNKNEHNPNTDLIENGCKSLLFNDCFLGWKDKAVAKLPHIPYESYAEILSAKAPAMKEFKYLFDEMAALCRALELKSDLGVRTRAAYRAKDFSALSAITDDYAETAKRVAKFRDEMYNVWMSENKPNGWEIHEVRFGGLIGRLDGCRRRILDYLNGRIDAIPELDEEILEYGDSGWLQYNLYRGLVTVKSL